MLEVLLVIILRLARSPASEYLSQPLFLCEIAWVLENAYRCSKNEIIAVIEPFMRTAQFEIGEKDVV